MAMFASGIGITPLRALLAELPYLPGEAVLFHRAGRHADLLFRRELDELAARRGLRIHYLLGRRSRDRASWLPANYAPVPDEQVLRHLVPDIAEHDVYVCGPDAWTEAVIDTARRAGCPRRPRPLRTIRLVGKDFRCAGSPSPSPRPSRSWCCCSATAPAPIRPRSPPPPLGTQLLPAPRAPPHQVRPAAARSPAAPRTPATGRSRCRSPWPHGKITDAQAVEYPQESGRDVRINSAAVPELNQETLQAQSAQIDTVSGATYTSEGYQQSLQSAIDAAHG